MTGISRSTRKGWPPSSPRIQNCATKSVRQLLMIYFWRSLRSCRHEPIHTSVELAEPRDPGPARARSFTQLAHRDAAACLRTIDLAAGVRRWTRRANGRLEMARPIARLLALP